MVTKDSMITVRVDSELLKKLKRTAKKKKVPLAKHVRQVLRYSECYVQHKENA